MNIVIYNSSSFGGCFDYGRALIQAYEEHPDIKSVTWILPINSQVLESSRVQKKLLSDRPVIRSKLGKQLHFLWRVLVNPIKLLLILRKMPPSWIILNDFEQLSAILWVPLYRLFLARKHALAVILHDPDRDAYPPSLWFTRISMIKLLSLMDLAIYHDFLPDKPYYKSANCKFINLPHGSYSMPEADGTMLELINSQISSDSTLMAIIGNIRSEKNYDLAINALVQLPNHKLIIAGQVANARVDVEQYKVLAQNLKVNDRIIWIEKFLTESEMSAIIELVDVVLLNYATTFTSQSGILNIVAPFRKELIVSDGPSSLATLLRNFKIGELVEPQSISSLVNALKKLENKRLEVSQNWEDYLEYASWKNHVTKAILEMKTTKPQL